MMWGGAISKLLLLRILMMAAVLFVIVLIGVTFHYKKMEIVDIAVDIAVAVFYEMMELVNFNVIRVGIHIHML